MCTGWAQCPSCILLWPLSCCAVLHKDEKYVASVQIFVQWVLKSAKTPCLLWSSVILCDILAGILRESELYDKLETLVQGHEYVIYGDPAYPLRPLLLKPYGGATLTQEQQEFNAAMSAVRQAVEWGFGKVISEFAFLDLKKKPENFFAGCAPNVQGCSIAD